MKKQITHLLKRREKFNTGDYSQTITINGFLVKEENQNSPFPSYRSYWFCKVNFEEDEEIYLRLPDLKKRQNRTESIAGKLSRQKAGDLQPVRGKKKMAV